METPFRNAAIIGVGLIGGSLGLALKKAYPAIHVRGIGRDSGRLETARTMGAIDDYAISLPGMLRDRDLVILATPIGKILEAFGSIGDHLSPGTVVTDVGSTKRVICETAWRTLPASVEFIGGHPIAGREVAGVENAVRDLFERAPYVLCPHPNTAPRNTRRLQSLAESIGAQVHILTPEAHDISMAWLSHAPQLFSTVLAAATDVSNLELAGTGFRDMIRLAGSPYSIWEGIFQTNGKNIDLALDLLVRKIEMIRAELKQGTLAPEFERAGQIYEMVKRLKSR